MARGPSRKGDGTGVVWLTGFLTLAVFSAVTHIPIVRLIVYCTAVYLAYAWVARPMLRRLHLDRDSRVEKQPCRLCDTVPNTPNHACTVRAEAKMQWHRVNGYYYRHVTEVPHFS